MASKPLTSWRWNTTGIHNTKKGNRLRSSIPLYDALAREYETGFYDTPHRKAYDQLAWERIQPLLPITPGIVVEAGCGAGRWVDRILALGHRVVGIEPAPQMVSALKRKNYGGNFRLIEGRMEDVAVDRESVDLVIAMGSLQYAEDPSAMIRKFADWTKPEGAVTVLTDSYMALVLELLNAGKHNEALERAETHLGLWQLHGHEAEMHLMDRETIESYFAAAGLTEIVAAGLLVTASAWGMPRCKEMLMNDEEKVLQLERKLAGHPRLADAAKQILVTGRKRRI